MKSKTLVVLEDDMFSSFNGPVKSAVNKYWDLTEFEFISSGEFNKERRNDDFSFLVPIQTSFQKDKSSTNWVFLNLLLGAKTKAIAGMPEFCSLPLYVKNESTEEFGFYIPVIVQFMQKRVALIKDNPDLKSIEDLSYYNKNIPELENKTIYVQKNDLGPEINTLEKISGNYPHKIKIVTEDEMREALNSGAENIVLLHSVGPGPSAENGRCYKMLFGIADNKMYYYNYHRINKKRPDGFLLRDLKRISRY